MKTILPFAMAVALLGGCQDLRDADVGRAVAPSVTPSAGPSAGPVNALAALDLGEIETTAEGRCFAKTDAPTDTTIVSELILVVPEERNAQGVVTTPPIYRNITRPQTRPVGEGVPFETLCPPQFTAETVSTLQRALRVRGIYAGPINGLLDADTGDAIGRLQRPEGIESNLLALRTARQLGIVAVPLDQL